MKIKKSHLKRIISEELKQIGEGAERAPYVKIDTLKGIGGNDVYLSHNEVANTWAIVFAEAGTKTSRLVLDGLGADDLEALKALLSQRYATTARIEQ